jgi:hypothetical protein
MTVRTRTRLTSTDLGFTSPMPDTVRTYRTPSWAFTTLDNPARRRPRTGATPTTRYYVDLRDPADRSAAARHNALFGQPSGPRGSATGAAAYASRMESLRAALR